MFYIAYKLPKNNVKNISFIAQKSSFVATAFHIHQRIKLTSEYRLKVCIFPFSFSCCTCARPKLRDMYKSFFNLYNLSYMYLIFNIYSFSPFWLAHAMIDISLISLSATCCSLEDSFCLLYYLCLYFIFDTALNHHSLVFYSIVASLIPSLIIVTYFASNSRQPSYWHL